MHSVSYAKGIIVSNAVQVMVAELEKHTKPSSMTAFVDCRWSNGCEFTSAGFKAESVLQPQLWWFKRGEMLRHSAEQFSESIAPLELGEEFTSSCEQVNYLLANGWMRIYDCGKLKLEKHND